MRNNAHLGESEAKRLSRLKSGPPLESIESLLNSINNYMNNEIQATTIARPPQTSLLFLGIHAVALTISQAFFNDKTVVGYKLFLEKFIDSGENDKKFSLIAEEIHDWRNVLAHQWLGSKGHRIGYDYLMLQGWKRIGGILYINPKIYQEQYIKAFDSGSSLWHYDELFNELELEAIKKRIITKFIDS